VQGIIKILLGKELPIVVVQNVSGRSADSEVRYHVKMECAAHSQEIRSKFGYFFTKGTDTRPPSLASVSIGNRLTPASQIRIAILKLLAKRYVDSNEGGKARVVSYEARPMLKITPPAGASDMRVKNFTYMEAIRKLPVNFTPTELRPILNKAGHRFSGRLRSTFVVLSDDMKVASKDTGDTRTDTASSAMETEANDDVDDDVVSVQSGSGGRSGAGTGSGSGRGQKRGSKTPAGGKSKMANR
jgi:hypothetical protein